MQARPKFKMCQIDFLDWFRIWKERDEFSLQLAQGPIQITKLPWIGYMSIVEQFSDASSIICLVCSHHTEVEVVGT